MVNNVFAEDLSQKSLDLPQWNFDKIFRFTVCEIIRFQI